MQRPQRVLSKACYTMKPGPVLQCQQVVTGEVVCLDPGKVGPYPRGASSLRSGGGPGAFSRALDLVAQLMAPEINATLGKRA